MLSASAIYRTDHASKYLKQLCKHFGHKVEVSYTDSEGKCVLPPGPAVLEADDATLHVRVAAEDEKGLALAKHIIDSHLVTFAFREDFKSLNWTDLAAEPAKGA